MKYDKICLIYVINILYRQNNELLLSQELPIL
jgi:hypothetical protein